MTNGYIDNTIEDYLIYKATVNEREIIKFLKEGKIIIFSEGMYNVKITDYTYDDTTTGNILFITNNSSYNKVCLHYDYLEFEEENDVVYVSK